jgi:hypothetical protein
VKKSEAIFAAESLLELIIKNQPNFLTEKTGVHVTSGGQLAAFVDEFVEQHAKNLVNRSATAQ